MSDIKIIQENLKLKKQLSQYKQVLGSTCYIDDSTLKGGYRVVKSITERDEIDCCHKKVGMIVTVKITDTQYKNYRLVGTNPCTNNWVEVTSDGTIPGLSAYEIWLSLGNVGTEQDFIDSLEGDTGPPGPQGPPGEISLLTFEVDDNMHLIMQLETNTNLNFSLNNSGHLILNN